MPRRSKDPDVVRLNYLKKQYKLATNQDAQWAMMYFIEDYTDEIIGLLSRLRAKGRIYTFPDVRLPDIDPDREKLIDCSEDT